MQRDHCFGSHQQRMISLLYKQFVILILQQYKKVKRTNFGLDDGK